MLDFDLLFLLATSYIVTNLGSPEQLPDDLPRTGAELQRPRLSFVP